MQTVTTIGLDIANCRQLLASSDLILDVTLKLREKAL